MHDYDEMFQPFIFRGVVDRREHLCEFYCNDVWLQVVSVNCDTDFSSGKKNNW